MTAVVGREPSATIVTLIVERPTRVRPEVVAGEPVAAGTWNDVDRRAAGLRLAESSGDLHAHFLGVGDVGDIPAGHPHDPGAAAGVDDRPVHHDAALRAAFGVVGRRVRAQVVDVVVTPDADAADAVRPEAGGGQAGGERQ